ncbi:MAG: InlB B-repeat-containing protein, partial [Lachnospiraceae bacterium]
MKKKKRRMQWLSCLLMCVMLINFVVLSTVSDASDIKKITMEEETTKPSIETQINEPLFELEETTNQITSLINNPAFHCETLLQALYASGHFYEVFQNLAEDTRENFYQKLSGEELYQFSTLAQYALVNEFVTYQKKEHLTEQDMQSLAAFFDCYVTVCKKEMSVTTQQELEEAVVELVRTGCSKEKTMQTKEGQTKIEQIVSLSTYIEYLQNLESSSLEEFPFEFQEFLQNFSENVKNFTQSESIQVFQKCMYETYGFATLYQELINKKSESEQQEELVQKTIEPLVSEEHRPVLENQESSIDLSGLVTGSDADHTHIFESKLDNTFHWKECFLCKKVIEKERHTIITDGNGATCSDYVILGKEICSQNCGYSKEIKKLPHIYPPNVSYSDFTGTRHLIHTCSRCGSVGEEPHKFRVGGGEYTVYQMQDMGWNIHTLGKQTCSICNLTVDLSKHNGWGYLCYLCKGTYAPRLYFEVPGNQIVNGKLKLDFVNANSQTVYLEMQGSGVASISARIISANPNFTVGSLTGIETLPNDRHRYSFTVSVKDRNKPIDQEFVLFGETSNKYNAGAWIDGYQTVTDFYGTTSINVVPDATGPTIQSITAKDVATAGEWASSKQLTISGSSEKNTMVYASMYYDTWVPVFQKKAVSVVNGQYSVSDIPVLEVDQPRTFHFKVEDAFGNEVWSTKILGKIDNRAPKMISSKDYINGWSKTKEVKITTEDGGINQVSIGFNSMSDISIGTLDGVNSTKTYRFTGDVYDVVTGAVYMRDGLGNIATERIQIGKLDQTGPTVTKIKKTATMDQVVLDITASDYCKKVEGEGSGVVSYALTTSDQTPPASAFQSNPQFTVSENGTYKVWAKDLVENISKAESVVVDEIAYTVQFLDANGTVLKTEQVPKGGTATPPTPLPQKEGYHFTKWDVAITNITSNTIVKPVFEINRYHATYLDAQGKVFETVEVEHGADVVVPTKEPTKEGYHFIQWDTTP